MPCRPEHTAPKGSKRLLLPQLHEPEPNHLEDGDVWWTKGVRVSLLGRHRVLIAAAVIGFAVGFWG